jgi:chlorite dismutase
VREEIVGISQTTYACYPVFRAGGSRRDLESDAAQEVENLLKEWSDRVSVRGVYSTTGFRPDADLMLWLIGPSPDVLQDLLVAFRRTAAGRSLELTWSLLGIVRPAEFAPDHIPAFVKGDAPRKYLCVYPFVRTEEWYLLPAEDRAALLREHGEMGREYPDVLGNTTSAFGLGDWEWILAFEADELSEIVDCIRRLREAGARRYTKLETPFVTGIRKQISEVIGDIS